MSKSGRHYWCVFCARALPVTYNELVYDDYGNRLECEQGYIVHDEVPHPLTATYDEESNPQ